MTVYKGNAGLAARERRGWFWGHFAGPPGAPPHSEALELKWAEHRAGESRAEWSRSHAFSLAVLIRGRFRLKFPEEEVVLTNEGDFVYWNPGLLHTWEAEEDSLILTVRWPSLPPA